MNKERVVITGMGVTSALGNSPWAVTESLIRGESGIRKITSIPAPGLVVTVAGEVDIDALGHTSCAYPRYKVMALHSAQQALRDARLNCAELSSHRTAIIISSGKGGMSSFEEEHQRLLTGGAASVSHNFLEDYLSSTTSSFVSLELGIRKATTCNVVTASATGTHSIGMAAALIQGGRCDVAIAGATESPITPLLMTGFWRMGALAKEPVYGGAHEIFRPYDARRSGFILGEGSGVLVLESIRHAMKRNARIYAELLGWVNIAEAFHMTAIDAAGQDIAKAISLCLSRANQVPSDIHYINSHGTATRLNDIAETRAIKQVFGNEAHQLSISATKPMTGHLLGASGSVEFVIALLAMERGFVPPTLNLYQRDTECTLDYTSLVGRQRDIRNILSLSYGFGGHIGVLAATRDIR